MEASKKKRSEAEQIEAVGKRFDIIFEELSFVEAFVVKAGARWPDPHVPEPDFRLVSTYQKHEKVTEAARRSLESLVESVLVEEGLISKDEFEYSALNASIKGQLDQAVFRKGFRLSPSEPDAGIESVARAKKRMGM